MSASHQGAGYAPLDAKEDGDDSSSASAAPALIFPPELALTKPRVLKIVGDRVVWYRPLTLVQLLHLKVNYTNVENTQKFA